MSSGSGRTRARGGHVAVNGALLYVREIGAGPAVVVLHGGPDFDHTYLLPETDELADRCRLVYYDQRGRGRSAAGVRPEDVTMASETADLEHLRRHLRLNSMAVLGHSWGGVLAMEYAIRYPERVSHLILMNTAPASGLDFEIFRERLGAARSSDDVAAMQAIAESSDYQAGGLGAESAYYRVHFGATVRSPEQLEQVVGRLRAHFTEQSVRTAREIERRLYEETWLSPGYDLIPELKRLDIPTLVLHSEQDMIPVEIAARIADAVPGAHLTVLPGCGHFAYLEQPALISEVIGGFVTG
jgi:proline iminopeptidase